eukprot:c27319_g1_i3 orf=475-1629(+)
MVEKGMRRSRTCWVHNGDNSSACPRSEVKLFGVRLMEGGMGKSVILGNLSHCSSSSQNQPSTSDHSESEAVDEYVSDEPLLDMLRSSRERKKGVPWTENEHRMFLFGLQKLGKGDWRGISRNFVTTRTPTQVASHAQKYFLRQINMNKRKRRSSLFDIPANSLLYSTIARERLHKISDFCPPNPELCLDRGPSHHTMSINRKLSSNCVCKGCFPRSAHVSEMPLGTHLALGSLHSVTDQNDGSGGLELSEDDKNKMPIAISSCTSISEASEVSAGTSNPEPFALQLWPGLGCQEMATSVPSSPGCICEFTDTTPTAMPDIAGIDESVEMFNLTLAIGPPCVDPCSLSINKLHESPTHSTFHTSPSIRKSRMNSNKNLSRTISVI